MSLISSLPILGKLAVKLLEAWDKNEKRKQLLKQEQMLNEIKEKPKSSHSKYFGPSRGRLRDDE